MDSVVRLLFHELADLSPCERERVFRERQIAPEIRAEVESLLSFDSLKDIHLPERVSRAAEGMLNSEDDDEGTDCGAYRLIRRLGSGGMAAVYLAERTDGEIKQQVAVKLLHAGVDRPAWRGRFLNERQLLAFLNHPSIARVIDAGHTSDGRPYLAMEYVEGVPIDIYVAETDPREKLTLFLRVCDAVAHAHRHLIIHRDLKPSNILVDASGQPKLLDFGIAKLLDTDATQTLERMLTPNYASPEQLRGASQTTATDVYSLGAVLYKLVAGRSPHESEAGTLQPLDVIAGGREIPPPSRLNPSVPSDIDYILRKALRPEPEERYASVEAFASDIRAFLEYRPVQARSGNAWYRTRKFLRRYWMPVAAAMVTIAGLLLGLYVANRERAIAQQRFAQVRQLANKLFDIDLAVRQGGATKARQLIVDTALEYLGRLAGEVHGDPELALELGNAYMRVARVQGVPIGSTLGQMEQAEQSLQKAEAFVESALAGHPGNRTALLRSAQIAHDRMFLAALRRPPDQALVFARKSAESLEKFLSTGKPGPPDAEAAVVTYTNVARRYMAEYKLHDALRLCRRAVDVARALRPQFAGIALELEAEIHRRQGDLDEALRAARESAKLLEVPAGSADIGRTLNFALALTRQGLILGEDRGLSLGRSEEAVVPLERAFQIAEDIARQDPNDANSRSRLLVAGTTLGNILRHSDARRALAIYDHMLRRMAEIKSNSRFRREEARSLAGSTYALRRLGRHAEAKLRLDAAFSRLRQLKLYPAKQIELGSEEHHAVLALADYEAGNGNIARAIEIYRNLLDLVLAAKPETSLIDAVDLSNLYEATAMLYRRVRQTDLASALEVRRLKLWQHWDSQLPNNPFVRRQLEAAGLLSARTVPRR